MKKYLFIPLILSFILVGCGKENIQTPTDSSQTGSVKEATIQPTSQTNTTWSVTIATGAMQVMKETPESPEGSIVQPIIKPTTDFLNEVCMSLAKAQFTIEGSSSETAHSTFKKCAERAAIESKDYKFCLNQIETYGISKDTGEDLVDCARAIMLQAITKSVEKNWAGYPENFCKNIYTEIESGGGRDMGTEGYRETLKDKSQNIKQWCNIIYAIKSKNPKICTDYRIWNLPPNSFNYSDDWERVSVKNQNACLWSIYIESPKSFTKEQACQAMRWPDVWCGSKGEVDEDGISDAAQSLSALGDIPSVDYFRGLLQKSQQSLEVKQASDNKMSKELNNLLK